MARLQRKRNESSQEAQIETTPAQPASPPKKSRRVTNFSPLDVYYWGYGSGVVATQVPDWGEFALAELTQTFDKNDVTYSIPSPKISKESELTTIVFLVRPKTKAQETTAGGYNNRFAVFKPMFRQNYTPSIELYGAGPLSDERASDDVGYLR